MDRLMSETITREDSGPIESREAFDERKARLLLLVTPRMEGDRYVSRIFLHTDIIETDATLPRFGLHTEDYLACREMEAEGQLILLEILGGNQAIWMHKPAWEQHQSSLTA